MKIRKIDHVSINVIDIQKTLDFYSQILGIKQLENDPWPLIGTTYTEGAIVDGEVVSSSAVRRAMGNPRPPPRAFVVKNGSKTRFCSSAGTPGPVSRTSIVH